MANKTRVQRTPKKRAATRRPRRSKNLPEPIDLATERIVVPQPTQSSASPLQAIGNLFRPKETNQAQPESISQGESLTSSGNSTSDPLSAESERLLDSVPESIGGEVDDAGGPAAVSSQVPEDPIAALMAQVAFEEQDVKDTLGELFDWLAERFESDHWRLTDRQTRMLGRPAAQMLNAIWGKLQVYIPDILGKWCEDTPGATAFILACGIVVVPKVTKQVAISRQRAKTRGPVIAPQPARPQAVPPKPKMGIVFDPEETHA